MCIQVQEVWLKLLRRYTHIIYSFQTIKKIFWYAFNLLFHPHFLFWKCLALLSVYVTNELSDLRFLNTSCIYELYIDSLWVCLLNTDLDAKPGYQGHRRRKLRLPYIIVIVAKKIFLSHPDVHLQWNWLWDGEKKFLSLCLNLSGVILQIDFFLHWTTKKKYCTIWASYWDFQGPD